MFYTTRLKRRHHFTIGQLSQSIFVSGNAGKSFNFLPLLGTHMVSEPLLRLRRQTRIMEFFDAELKPRPK